MTAQNISEARNKVKKLTEELLNENPRGWCPQLEMDNQGPFCGNLLNPEIKRLVCCPESLQLYCLDPEKHTACIYHPQHTP